MAAGPSLDDRDPRRTPKGGASRRTARAPGRGGSKSGATPGWLRALRIGLGIATLGAFAAVAVVVGLFSFYGSDPKLPNLSRLDAYRPKQVTRILDRNGAPIGELGSEKRTVVPYDAIPKMLVQAVVSAEDADYFQHGGLDYRGMLRAFIEDVLRGRRVQGGSTITQQVVKTMLLSPERTLRRKVQEIILARQLTQKLSMPNSMPSVHLSEFRRSWSGPNSSWNRGKRGISSNMTTRASALRLSETKRPMSWSKKPVA